MHGAYSLETWALPLEQSSELAALINVLESLGSDFDVGAVYTSCTTTRSESSVDINVAGLRISATTCMDTKKTYFVASAGGRYRWVYVPVFTREALAEFVDAVRAVHTDLLAWKIREQERRESILAATPILAAEKQAELLAICSYSRMYFGGFHSEKWNGKTV